MAKLGKTRLASIEPGVRAFLDAKSSMSVMKAAAKAAFWQLSRNTLETIAETEGVEIQPNSDLLEVVSCLTQHSLGISAEACTPILEQRLAIPLRAASVSEAILEVDEAAACLREDDWKAVSDEKKRSEEKSRDAGEFRVAFRKRAATFRKAPASGSKGTGTNILGYKGWPSCRPRRSMSHRRPRRL